MIDVIVALIVLGVALYIIKLLPIAEVIKKIINALVVLVIGIYVLRALLVYLPHNLR